jgi:hypothetical protein
VKKIIAFVLTIAVMTLCLGFTAFAAEKEPPDGSYSVVVLK